MADHGITRISGNVSSVNSISGMESVKTQLTDHQNRLPAGKRLVDAEENREGFELAARPGPAGSDRQDRPAESKSAHEQTKIAAAFDRIKNANIAQEQVEYTKLMIRRQTATAILTQANASPQGVLQLLS